MPRGQGAAGALPEAAPLLFLPLWTGAGRVRSPFCAAILPEFLRIHFLKFQLDPDIKNAGSLSLVYGLSPRLLSTSMRIELRYDVLRPRHKPLHKQANHESGRENHQIQDPMFQKFA